MGELLAERHAAHGEADQVVEADGPVERGGGGPAAPLRASGQVDRIAPAQLHADVLAKVVLNVNPTMSARMGRCGAGGPPTPR